MTDEEEKMNLLEYLPDYLKEYEELQQIMQTETVELQELENMHTAIIDDRFLTSCKTYGMERYEKMMAIMPLADDTLESRRFRAISKWNNTVPYNYRYLEKQLELLCGKKGYRIELNIPGQKLFVKVELISKNMFDSVCEMIEAVVPYNISLKVELLYNQHSLLSRFSHTQLAAYTYGQLRDEVIS